MILFLSYLKRMFLYAGLTPEEYRKIQDRFMQGNRQNLRVFSCFSLLLLMILLAMTYFLPNMVGNRPLYLGTFLCMLPIYLFSRTNPSSRFLILAIHAFLFLFFAFGIVLGAFFNPNQNSSTFLASLIVLPLLFMDKPIRISLLLILGCLVFMLTAKQYKPYDIYVSDVINAFLFSFVSLIISTYMMQVKSQRYLYELQVVSLSETDLLTGLKNRNSYEKNLLLYPARCRSNLFCVYMDVNGLHEMNNELGHEAGDQMLQFIATVLQCQFGAGNSYRIGGDEFVAFLPDSTEQYISSVVAGMRSAIEEKHYHASIGYAGAECPIIGVQNLVNEAEKQMYADKNRYYSQNGIDRRSRR